ncbi:hypothetical protein GALMADRAFT_230604 [Galerina marginata CBS 339.88]|uniref:Uncharacterized protein n=1 Tax=Galerina marginata (strain CBS 339.88) TaxID=685588 RepID=A0A067SFD5_GALM3|nr:hypothetical protein GALMADRAFT_230604 [Galerina marginata CBS 339.88]
MIPFSLSRFPSTNLNLAAVQLFRCSSITLPDPAPPRLPLQDCPASRMSCSFLGSYACSCPRSARPGSRPGSPADIQPHKPNST